MAESEESPRDKIVKWKSALEAKGLKMNMGKTKVMFSCSMKDRAEEKGKWPCGRCKKEDRPGLTMQGVLSGWAACRHACLD